MTEAMQLPAFYPALPEIILAIGAMVLLMFGAFRGDGATCAVNGLAVGLLLIAILVVALMPATTTVRKSSRA